MDIAEVGSRLALMFIPFLLALCVHEFAHGLVAHWLGDNTAKMSGRLTLNPMAHADPLGTFALPIMSIVFSAPIFFGWAKPVPVDVRNLKNPRQDTFWIALAGPLSNILMACLASLLMGALVRLVPAAGSSLALLKILNYFILINLFLAFFNLIPLHPLDGGKVIARFLPFRWNYWLENNQSTTGMILIALIILPSIVPGFPGLGLMRGPIFGLHALLVSWI
jgi:Zn-dependent protease